MDPERKKCLWRQGREQEPNLQDNVVANEVKIKKTGNKTSVNLKKGAAADIWSETKCVWIASIYGGKIRKSKHLNILMLFTFGAWSHGVQGHQAVLT